MPTHGTNRAGQHDMGAWNDVTLGCGCQNNNYNSHSKVLRLPGTLKPQTHHSTTTLQHHSLSRNAINKELRNPLKMYSFCKQQSRLAPLLQKR